MRFGDFYDVGFGTCEESVVETKRKMLKKILSY